MSEQIVPESHRLIASRSAPPQRDGTRANDGGTQSGYLPYLGKTFNAGFAVVALPTLSSKGQLVIPGRLRQLFGLQPGDRLALTLEADGLRCSVAPVTRSP